MPSNSVSTIEDVKKLKAEVASIKKDIFDLKKIILQITVAKSDFDETQDLKNIEDAMALL